MLLKLLISTLYLGKRFEGYVGGALMHLLNRGVLAGDFKCVLCLQEHEWDYVHYHRFQVVVCV